MGADSGIYILRTLRTTIDNEGWVERCEPYPVWRVAYAHAIDNFFYYQQEQPYNLGAYMLEVWGKSPVFTSLPEAQAMAEQVLKKIKRADYGISVIDTDYHFYTDA